MRQEASGIIVSSPRKPLAGHGQFAGFCLVFPLREGTPPPLILPGRGLGKTRPEGRAMCS